MFNKVMMIGALALVGCSGGADLPEGWEAATAISGLKQSECKAETYDDAVKEQLTATSDSGAINLQYSEAPFRCAQSVEGFLHKEGSKVDVLVQPMDMDPDSVAKCDCRYDIDMALKDVGHGSLAIELYRRWDNINHPNDPQKVASASVELP